MRLKVSLHKALSSDGALLSVWYRGKMKSPATPAGDEENMNTNGGTPDEIVTALRQGIEAGKLDSTPGNVFRSAWPAAASYGYTGDCLLRAIFTNGYLSELPSGGVLIDSNGVVVGGPKHPQSKVGQYISCQTCHKPAGDQATKESGTCQDCKGRIIRERRQREANRANLRSHLAANS